VLCAQDILDVLGLPGGKAAPPTTEEEEGLLRFLPRGESLSVDELAQLSGLALPELLRETARLEVAGKLLRDADGRFRRP
jgi:predicted transcriptional regulator